MTTTTDHRTLLPLRVPALCCECGTVREVAFRNASCAETRSLKCATCRRTTVHTPIKPPGWDVHEHLNSKVKVKLTVPQKLDVLRGLDVEVLHADNTTRAAALWWHTPEYVFTAEISSATPEAQLDGILDEMLVRVTAPSTSFWRVRIEDDGAVVPCVGWHAR